MRFGNFAASMGSVIFAIILVYGLFSSLPWDGPWAGPFGQIKIDLLLFWGGLFLFILVKPEQLLGWLRRLAERTSLKRLLILALILRLGWVIFGRVEQVSDFKNFHNMAIDILHGKYIIYHHYPTGSAIFFALHYLIFGINEFVPTISLAILSTLQIWLVYSLVFNITFDKTIAIVSSMLLVVWPDHILFTNLLGSDVLFSVIVFFGMWLLLKSRNKDKWKISAGLLLCSGLTFGAAYWVRPTAPLFILAALCFLVIDNNVLLKRFLYPACFLAGVIFLVIPMMFCNKATLGIASPFPSQIRGWSMLVGTNIVSHGRWTQADEDLVEREAASRVPGPNENQAVFRDRVAKELALKRLKEDPIGFIKMVMKYKFAALWGRGEELGWSIPDTSPFYPLYWPVTFIERLYHMLIVLLASAAIFRRCHPIVTKWNVVTVFIYSAILTTGSHIFLETKPRYNHMFLPLLAICAASLIASISSAAAPKNSVQTMTEMNHRTKNRTSLKK